MTPDELEGIRKSVDRTPNYEGLPWWVGEDLLDYIDTLHLEIYMGREELVAEKHKVLALRRGQGSAPEPGTPEHPPFHHTHPIHDSTKGE